MDWQQIISLVIVALTVALLVRGRIQKRRRAKLRACDHDCGCGAASPLRDQIEALRLSKKESVQ